MPMKVLTVEMDILCGVPVVGHCEQIVQFTGTTPVIEVVQKADVCFLFVFMFSFVMIRPFCSLFMVPKIAQVWIVRQTGGQELYIPPPRGTLGSGLEELDNHTNIVLPNKVRWHIMAERFESPFNWCIPSGVVNQIFVGDT